MTFLLDVNALCAALLQAHVHHGRFHSWAATLAADTRYATCAISELGFVRVAHAAHGLSVADAVALLRQFKRSSSVDFIGELPSPDGLLPGWAQSHRQTTDGYLTGLARHHAFNLATFDAGIRDSHAELIP